MQGIIGPVGGVRLQRLGHPQGVLHGQIQDPGVCGDVPHQVGDVQRGRALASPRRGECPVIPPEPLKRADGLFLLYSCNLGS